VARHVAADGHAVGALSRRQIGDLAAGHDGDAIGELENLVEILRHQQHRGEARRVGALIRSVGEPRKKRGANPDRLVDCEKSG
jgi:hypothetical protein